MTSVYDGQRTWVQVLDDDHIDERVVVIGHIDVQVMDDWPHRCTPIWVQYRHVPYYLCLIQAIFLLEGV